MVEGGWCENVLGMLGRIGKDKTMPGLTTSGNRGLVVLVLNSFPNQAQSEFRNVCALSGKLTYFKKKLSTINVAIALSSPDFPKIVLISFITHILSRSQNYGNSPNTRLRT